MDWQAVKQFWTDKAFWVKQKRFPNFIWLWLVFLSILVADPAFSASHPEPLALRADLGVRVQHFKWAEYGAGGIQLVEETGLLYGLKQELAFRKGTFGWRQGASVFYGKVDYEGYTWTLLPIQTDVTYIGGTAFFDLEPGYQWPSGLLVKGIAGLGGRLWLRDLDDTRTELGTRVGGAEEWWWTICGRAGAGAVYPVDRFGRFFLTAGIKWPIYTRNEATFFVQGSPDIDLEPEPDISPFARIGWRWRQMKCCLFYESLRFKASDRVESGGYDLYQPESEADMIGADLSWTFCF
jgi:hypothetical protein